MSFASMRGMMTPTIERNVDERVERAREDHRALRELTQRLERGTDSEGWPVLLRELEQRLATHFEYEERDDGLFDVIARIAPERDIVLDELRKAHGTLLASVRELREQADALQAGSRDLRSGTGELLARLHEHEAAEEELLVEALEHDVAAVD
jgi:hypothetical protein